MLIFLSMKIIDISNCTTGAPWTTISEYPTPIEKSSHHNGKHIPQVSSYDPILSTLYALAPAATSDVVSTDLGRSNIVHAKDNIRRRLHNQIRTVVTTSKI